MFRWMLGIEKSGTGIEKSGTGIEKSGTGIEKSGTGIEKSGTGIEKSGTGIRKGLLACSMAFIVFAGNLNAGNIDPAGSLQLVVQNNKVAVSWIIGDSVFSGIASLNGSYAHLSLTEIALTPIALGTEVAGHGTGTDVAGHGTGKEVAGHGTGTEVAGHGTGTDVAGHGTGTDVAGHGTGTDVAGHGTGTDVAGHGTGTDVAGHGTGTDVAGHGTGTDVAGHGTGTDVAGHGTGADAITITLPQGTGLAMEVSMGCGFASVSVVDLDSVQVVGFNMVPVIGDPDFCDNSFSKRPRDKFLN